MFDYLYRDELEVEAREEYMRKKMGSRQYKRSKITPSQRIRKDKQRYKQFVV